MIITTTYESESKAEAKALRMMALNMEGAGMEFQLGERQGYVVLHIKESRRARKGSGSPRATEQQLAPQTQRTESAEPTS